MQASLDINDYNAVAARVPTYQKDWHLFAAEQLVARKKPPNPRLVPLCPFLSTQEIIDRAIEKQLREIGFIRMVALKERQQGFSTYTLGRLYHMAALNPFTNTFSSAHDLETAETLFRTVKLFHEEMHPAIRPKTRRSTVRQLVFEDEQNPEAGLRSSMTIDTAKKISFAIGRTISALHFSEVSRYELVAGRDQVRFAMSAAMNAVPMAPGTAIILESTAFVTGAFFKDMVERAQRNEGAWRFVFVPWFISKDYRIPLLPGEKITPTKDERHLIKQFNLTPAQIKFRRFKIAEFRGDEALFRQDYASTVEEAFLVLGRSIFPPHHREKLKRHIRPPARTCGIFPGKGIIDVDGGALWIWETPQQDAEYDIGIDIAMDAEEASEDPGEHAIRVIRADDEDQNFSAMQVVRRGTLEQVAEWKGRVAPIALAELAATLGYYYNTAQLAPESKGIGVATTGHLNTVLRYPNVYRWRYRDRAKNLTKYYGWDTTPTSKSYLVAFAIDVVSRRAENDPLIHSTRLYAELETFVQVGYQRYEAAAGNQDDLAMCWLISLVTSNDEDFSKFISRESDHEEKVEEKFYEPGKAPRRTDVDPAFTDADADARVPIGAGSEVEGW